MGQRSDYISLFLEQSLERIAFEVYNGRMDKVKKAGLIFFSVVLNLIAGGIIYYFWKPIALWYFNHRPILGIDFYNLSSYVAYLARHFVFQFNGWKYTWWTGGPLSIDYPLLHAYLALPLLKFFSLPQAIQVYVLGSCFLFLFFSYLLFAEIGKDRVLAVVLAIAFSFSIGFYGALVMGGSLPYFATQAFLPATLWLLVKFFNTADKRFFYLSSLFLGISFLGHPQVGFSYLIPTAFLLLVAHPIEGEKFVSFERLKRVLIYFLVALLAGYPQMGLYLGRTPLAIFVTFPATLIQVFRRMIGLEKGPIPTLGGGQTPTPESKIAVAKFNRAQLQRFFTDTNELFFYFLVAAAIVFLLSFLIRKKKKESLKVIPFVLPVLWVIFYGSLLGFGVGLFHGGWYRVFWPLPLVLGMFISFVWGDFWISIKERLGLLGQRAIFGLLIPIVSGAIILLPGLVLLSQNSAEGMITEIETPFYRQQSSALPDSLGVDVGKEELEELKEKLTPAWLNPNETNYRLYDADQRVNIWWNALYDMPLVKGYVEFPPGDAATGSFYWTSIALTATGGSVDSLVEQWGVPEEMAYNNALFLMDWFSIKYLEAEHEKSDSYNPFTSYLAKSDIFANKEKVVVPGWAQLYQTGDNKIKFHPEEEEYLTYYEVKENLVSPIAHTTNASTVGIIGPLDAYNTVIRNLATVNLNSRKVIPIRLGQFIDNVSYQSLKDMDVVILYAYDYKNHGKTWGKLETYVEDGGRVLIETGSDVKQTDSVNLPGRYPKQLPSVFPIEMTKQEAMGTDWRLSGGSKETEGVNLEVFGPPVLDGEPWLFSLPNLSQDLREGARVILANRGVPLIVAWQYGKGEVIWSGMNLPYHVTTHKNVEEANFFENLLEDFIDTSAVSYQDFEVNRVSPNKIVVKGANAKGVLFKENSNPGWKARLSSPKVSQNLKIYKTGLTYHGFSYVKIPQQAQESFTVTFSYRGEFWVYFWTLVWFLTILLILDYVLFGSRFLAPVLRKISTPVMKRVGRWWEKEEEY